MSGLDEKAVLAACEAYHADLPTHDYPSRWAMEQAIRAYLAATTPADVGEEPVAWACGHRIWWVKDNASYILADAEKMAESAAEIYGIKHEPLYSATALERVVRERDEARAEIERMTPQFVAYEYLESPAGREIAEAELHAVSAAIGGPRFMDPPDGGSVTLAEQVKRMREALESAEAKLAEARKVIEPFAEASREFNFAMGPDGIDDGITVIASTVVRDREATLSTSDFSAARRWIEETK